ncbi:uncharacterized protein L969DRAFT_103915 [Mixia osmundae IAM 14324]|uniref:Imidazole glycerol phosphate synthase hisHF n=1 Tax=Mixia osmundae (strain CBS 9802 / IAM 14324 / JCM 22182 / KY 12970) TaxID=764103 RepID=G7E7G0_MIXOS|nr:uncharacterized protein L969DRAFT_103915 [Mixia osmundae IAM 14324]KEI38930.1 hypothetical protein L969DRAFT_103915 [Mixia osmundae IAM 14324]GAA98770.1 hypothetical protein E5Q_05458 [Mixia osmundae IAM 14324]
MLYVLDYGAGNIRSLTNAIERLGFEFRWVKTPDDIARADKLLFPGVGSFGPAMERLRRQGFAEPLKEFIRSGKPYMGICIGMQCLFESSEEAPGTEGLGIIPAQVKEFDRKGKSVPHMGWNGAIVVQDTLSDDAEAHQYGLQDTGSYYYVHCFRASWEETLSLAPDWPLAVSRYGKEDFVAAVHKDNVFATQFHPEKSGAAGLNVLHAWLSQSGVAEATSASTSRSSRAGPSLEARLASNGFSKRIIACLDVRSNDQGDLVVTKGDQYDVREAEETSKTARGGAVRNLGKPVDLAQRYYAEGADEICFLNITSFRSCPLNDQPMLDVVRRSAETVFVPLTIGGGIRDTTDPDGTFTSALDVAGLYFRHGADKVSIGSDAVTAVQELLASGKRKTGKTAIETISQRYGRQAVVVSIDPRRVYVNTVTEAPEIHQACVVPVDANDARDRGPEGQRYCWYACTIKGGRETADLDVVQLAQGSELLGAGELLINSVDRDGSKRGFDKALIGLIRRSVSIPIVASSGAGSVEHFSDVFSIDSAEGQVEAALAAGIFHRKEVPIADVKSHLRTAGIPARNELQPSA